MSKDSKPSTVRFEVKEFPIFEGTYIAAWKKQISRKLDAKNLLGYIEDLPDFVRSRDTEKIVLDAITSRLDRKVATKVLSCNSSAEIWK